MKKPRLLLDVDGILADFAGSAARLMSKVVGRTITTDEIVNWEVTDVIDEHYLKDLCKEEMKLPGFCASIEAYEHSIKSVEVLQKISEVFFVTAPMHKSVAWMPERVAWLEKVFLVDPKDIIFAYKKHVVSGDIILDDHPDNVRSWLDSHPTGTGLLWERPYNIGLRPELQRVKSWDEVLNVVRSKCNG